MNFCVSDYEKLFGMLFEIKEDIKSIKHILEENVLNNNYERHSTVVNTNIIPEKPFKSIRKLFTYDEQLTADESKKQMVSYQKYVSLLL